MNVVREAGEFMPAIKDAQAEARKARVKLELIEQILRGGRRALTDYMKKLIKRD